MTLELEIGMLLRKELEISLEQKLGLRLTLGLKFKHRLEKRNVIEKYAEKGPRDQNQD